MEHYDVVIIGTGSGNMIPPDLDDRRIALVEKGTFGGTCLNRGCIPSKMLVYAADVATTVRHAGTYGLSATLEGVDWPGIVSRVFGRIDPIAAAGERYRVHECDNIDVHRGHARFVAPRTLEVAGERITGDHIVIGAGSRPFIPPVPGLADVPYETSDTIMRRESLPERLIILGGGYIAAELGHVFASLGSGVVILNRSPVLLRTEDDDVARRFTELARHRFEVHTRVALREVDHAGDVFTVRGHTPEGDLTVTGDALLVAAGRVPNSDQLNLDATGVDTHGDGRIIVNTRMETDVAGIWAFGDIVNPFQLKHVANAEARVVFHNIAHPDDQREMDYRAVPHAVFSDPQVAAVGATERELVAEEIPYVRAVQDYAGTAYGWAMEDTTSFVKVLAHRDTRRLLGAHILGPQASTLIQPLIGAMVFDISVDDLAERQMWIHPALTEVVENALLALR